MLLFTATLHTFYRLALTPAICEAKLAELPMSGSTAAIAAVCVMYVK
ncbi:MAG: hypothetical protein K5929_00010 [Lachnospiraceae bacterium]|nr:hypothetical protein [Lachnospiraceae bacterium]